MAEKALRIVDSFMSVGNFVNSDKYVFLSTSKIYYGRP